MDEKELKGLLEKQGVHGTNGHVRVDPDTGKVQTEKWWGWEDSGHRVDPESGKVQTEKWWGQEDSGHRIDPESGKMQTEKWWGHEDSGCRIDPESGKVQTEKWWGWEDSGHRVDPESGKVQTQKWWGWQDAEFPADTQSPASHGGSFGPTAGSSTGPRRQLLAKASFGQGPSSSGGPVFAFPIGLIVLLAAGAVILAVVNSLVTVPGSGSGTSPTQPAPAAPTQKEILSTGIFVDSVAVRIYNCDDECRVLLDGRSVAHVGFGEDSGVVDICASVRRDSVLTFLAINRGGAVTYGFELWDDGKVRIRHECGKASQVGCDSNSEFVAGPAVRWSIGVARYGDRCRSSPEGPIPAVAFDDLTGAWNLTILRDPAYKAPIYVNYLVYLTQSGTELRGSISPNGTLPATPIIYGEVRGDDNVVYFGSEHAWWNDEDDAYFSLTPNKTTNMMTGRCSSLLRCLSVVAIRR